MAPGAIDGTTLDPDATARPPAVQPPPAPRRLEDMALSPVMMRDILIKTMFRKNLEQVSDLAQAVCLPVQVTQELIDLARTQRLVEATGTLALKGVVHTEAGLVDFDLPVQLQESLQRTCEG